VTMLATAGTVARAFAFRPSLFLALSRGVDMAAMVERFGGASGCAEATPHPRHETEAAEIAEADAQR
jgi:hypothetical protein